MTKAPRIWQLDAARGAAVVAMVAYHILFDLDYLGMAKYDFSSLPLVLFQRIIAISFLLLVGISIVLSERDLRKTFFRAAFLFACAMAITIATSIYPGRGAITFGILHFIGLALLAGYFLKKLGNWNLAVAIAILAIWALSRTLQIGSPWLVWLGFPPTDFYSLDYFPVLPWLAVVALGIFIGGALKGRLLRKNPPAQFSALCLVGRNALWIYLSHQPLIIGALMLWKTMG